MRHLPNLICVLRMLLVWPIIGALRARNFELAMLLFSLAALSDGLDGFLAKRFHWTSRLGKALDPLADGRGLIRVLVALQ